MKHLTTLLTMAITLTGLGQQMPYNPDANGDDFVGVDDVLGVLGVYDTALMQPDLTCDYQGTTFENWVIGVLDESLVLDSIYVEYMLVDSYPQYVVGCPDPVMVETVLQRSYMIAAYDLSVSGHLVEQQGQSSYLGYPRFFEINYNLDNGEYLIRFYDGEVSELVSSFDASSVWEGHETPLPFNPEWTIDEEGLHVTWDDGSWLHNSDFWRIIPFWHEAE